MSEYTKIAIGASIGLVGVIVGWASPERPQAVAQPPAAACRCVDCLDDNDVRRIIAEELAKQSPKAPTAQTASFVPVKAASTDPLIGKKNSDGSVTIAVQYDVPAPLEAKRKLPPIRKPPMPLGGAVVDGVHGVVGGVVQGTCRIVNGVRICN